MRTLLPALTLLAACGHPIEGAWTGTCEATIGTIEIVTAELAESPPRQDVTGEHEHYTAGLAEIKYPAGEVFETKVSFVHCIDESGCDTPTDDIPEGNAYVVFEADGQQPQVVAYGPLKGRAIEGNCETGFGQDLVFLERTTKGLE